MGDLAVGLEVLMRQMADLATRKVYPVVWEESKALLTELQKKSSELGPIQTPRTPAEVEKTLAAAADLLARWQGMDRPLPPDRCKIRGVPAPPGGSGAGQSLEWCQGC